MTELTGPRVRLRPYRAADIPAIIAWNHDPDTTRWMGRRFRTPRPAAEIAAGVERVIVSPPVDGVFRDQLKMGILAREFSPSP